MLHCELKLCAHVIAALTAFFTFCSPPTLTTTLRTSMRAKIAKLKHHQYAEHCSPKAQTLVSNSGCLVESEVGSFGICGAFSNVESGLIPTFSRTVTCRNLSPMTSDLYLCRRHAGVENGAVFNGASSGVVPFRIQKFLHPF